MVVSPKYSLPLQEEKTTTDYIRLLLCMAGELPGVVKHWGVFTRGNNQIQ